MKIIKHIILIIAISCIITKNLSKSKKQNFSENPIAGVAVPNDNYLLQQTQGFRKPIMMSFIPKSINNNLNTGVIEKADTFVSDKNYYNGRDNINAIHINCNVQSTDPGNCVNKSGCGWCGQSNTCIPGNANGPLAPCLRNTFLFTNPSKHWNPLKSGTINTYAKNTKEQPLNHIVPGPDMNKVDVFKPYN